MFFTTKGFFWRVRGGMGALLLLSLYCTSGLYFAKLCIMNFSINLLVVYRESVNLIGSITRRLSADSLQL